MLDHSMRSIHAFADHWSRVDNCQKVNSAGRRTEIKIGQADLYRHCFFSEGHLLG
jgi:hypothetical protein